MMSSAIDVTLCQMIAGHRKLTSLAGSVEVNCSWFCGASGVTEWHITVVPTAAGTCQEHLTTVANGYRDALTAVGLDRGSAVWRRFFCSDIANQAAVLQRHAFSDPSCADDPCAVSHVGQAPLATAKLALWACHITDPAGPLVKSLDGPTLTLTRGTQRHLWTSGMARPDIDSVAQQTHGVFTDYAAQLAATGLTLADNVLRTWLFQPNIDLDYHGMCDARRAFFAANGLTADTHFIASTGIAGTHSLPTVRVFMDAYAIGGLQSGQVAYLTAPDHLGPTYDYGVTFERATAVAYQDRRQVFVSGTASIDPSGQIIHPGDVVRQLRRTLNNIEKLLESAGAVLGDMLVFIVYLRDASDHARVLPVLHELLGDVPLVVLAAPVCRPGWLIEIEGVAVVPAAHPQLPPF